MLKYINKIKENYIMEMLRYTLFNKTLYIYMK